MVKGASSPVQGQKCKVVWPNVTIYLEEKDNVDLEGSPTKGNTSFAPPRNTTTPSLKNKDFDTKSYMCNRFNFLVEFSDDHKMESQVGSKKMSNLVETYMLRGLMLERLMFDVHNQSYKIVVDLKTKLNTVRITFTQTQ